MTETKKPGYREQGKARAGNVKSNFAINAEQMEFEREKFLSKCLQKLIKRNLTTWLQLQLQ